MAPHTRESLISQPQAGPQMHDEAVRGGKSRMNLDREAHVRFSEGLGVKFPGLTRHSLQIVGR